MMAGVSPVADALPTRQAIGLSRGGKRGLSLSNLVF